MTVLTGNTFFTGTFHEIGLLQHLKNTGRRL